MRGHETPEPPLMMKPSDWRFCPRCAGRLAPSIMKEGADPRPACPACGFILYLNPRLAACTITSLDGGMVLARRGIHPEYGKWTLPGGFVERGESLPEAAVRETFEEVKVRVSLTGILDVYSFPGSDTVVAVYAADVLSGRPEPGEETTEVQVFPPEGIPWDELAFDSTRASLRDYLRRFYPRARVPRLP
jgi:ADP-ribose pyrophosphatase YjhB (NUDIX family)